MLEPQHGTFKESTTIYWGFLNYKLTSTPFCSVGVLDSVLIANFWVLWAFCRAATISGVTASIKLKLSVSLVSVPVELFNLEYSQH